MKNIFVTGSTTGLGLLAGELLLKQGHQVVFHARNEKTKKEALEKIGKDVPFVVGDVSVFSEMKNIAEEAAKFGPFDSVIHNVGIYDRQAEVLTRDHLRSIFAVNVLAPYVISTHLPRPARMVFLSSGMHLSGEANLEDPQWTKRTFNATQAYCDSKLFDLMLTKWFARQWPEAFINAVNPGWVPTRMGGSSAPDDLTLGAETQVWLSVSDDPAARVSGKYFYHKGEQKIHPMADSIEAQDRLVAYLQEISQ